MASRISDVGAPQDTAMTTMIKNCDGGDDDDMNHVVGDADDVNDVDDVDDVDDNDDVDDLEQAD